MLGELLKLFEFLKPRKWLIVYFTPKYYEHAKMLKDALGIGAEMKMAKDVLPPESDEYKYIVLIGNQNDNPIYRKFAKAGMLPSIVSKGYAIKKIGNMIFLTGYTPSDVLKACHEFIRRIKK